MTIHDLTNILHTEKCSAAIYSHGTLTLCHGRGIADLYQLLSSEPSVLCHALIADKVIGKGAAALMILGHVEAVYTDTISKPALQLLTQANIPTTYKNCVENIINRNHTGICPVEALCASCTTAEECLPLITKFINELHS